MSVQVVGQTEREFRPVRLLPMRTKPFKRKKIKRLQRNDNSGDTSSRILLLIKVKRYTGVCYNNVN